MIKTSEGLSASSKALLPVLFECFFQTRNLTRKTFSVSPEYKFKYCLCFLKKVIWQHGFEAHPDCWFQTMQRLNYKGGRRRWVFR